MNKAIALVIFILATVSVLGQDQRKSIKGCVTEASAGEPLIGVKVFIKNNVTDATSTGLDGSFILKTDVASPVICCTYIGFLPMEIPYTGSRVCSSLT